MAPASAKYLSTSGPNDAPVYTSILNSSFFARSTNAIGTTFASPARVKPLIPTTSPLEISAAASSAVTILLSSSFKPRRF